MNQAPTPKRILIKSLFDGVEQCTDQVMTIENGQITSIDADIAKHDQALDGLVVPGFVDLQVNGGGGQLFNDNPCLSSLEKIMAAHAQFGTTGMLPTIITDNIQTMQQAAECVSQAIKNNMPGILGIHFEGPHIASSKKGAHSQEFIRPISTQEWALFGRRDLGQIVVTLAPEIVPIDDIKRLVALGVHVCIGHSNADFDTSNAAVIAGAKGFTHLYNAMSPIQGRAPGVTGSALLNDQTQAGIIIDGHHVSAGSAKLALKAKPVGGIFLVTDAMPLVGTTQTEFDFFDRKVFCDKGKLTSTTGELAGSNLNMASAVRNTKQMLGVPLHEAIRMASLYPLSFLQKASLPIAPRALLSTNNTANFVQLDQDLKVKSSWINGQCVFAAK